MITKFKIFENDNSNEKIGFYVIANSNYASRKLQNFLKNNIGQIIEYDNDYDLYKVEYDTIIPEDVYLDDYYWNFAPSEILYVSENIEDLERILDAQKYNL